MSIANQVKKRIDRWPEQKVFRAQELTEYADFPKAVSESLSRQVKSDAIVRLSKGLFYKPRVTRFGKVRPDESAILESFLYRKSNSRKKQVAYLTGVSLYYDWGLTTQVPSEVQLASTESAFYRNLEGIRIRAKKIQISTLTEKKTKALQVLDVMKGLKNIPDSDPEKVLMTITKKIKTFDNSTIREAERLAVDYFRPSVVALLGAIFEDVFDYESKKLKTKISTLSKYSTGITFIMLIIR